MTVICQVPSTANRVYGLIYPGSTVPFATSCIANFVLPLMGFWNSVIYFVVSRAALRDMLVEDILPWLFPGRFGSRERLTARGSRQAVVEMQPPPPRYARRDKVPGSEGSPAANAEWEARSTESSQHDWEADSYLPGRAI